MLEDASDADWALQTGDTTVRKTSKRDLRFDLRLTSPSRQAVYTCFTLPFVLHAFPRTATQKRYSSTAGERSALPVQRAHTFVPPTAAREGTSQRDISTMLNRFEIHGSAL